MTHAMLGHMTIRASFYPTIYTPHLKGHVPQGKYSSPALFNMYISHLATELEARECVQKGDGEILMVADDVLLQSQSQMSLYRLLKIAT